MKTSVAVPKNVAVAVAVVVPAKLVMTIPSRTTDVANS